MSVLWRLAPEAPAPRASLTENVLLLTLLGAGALGTPSALQGWEDFFQGRRGSELKANQFVLEMTLFH